MEPSGNFLSAYREEILKCTSCGFCQAACPVFGVTFRPAYNTRGKMLLLKEVMEGLIEPSEDLVETFYTCTTCRACTYSCPRHIETPEIVECVRRELYAQSLAPSKLVGIKDSVCRSGNVYAAPGNERIDIYPLVLKERMRKGEFKDTAGTLVFMGCLPSYLDMKIVPSLLKALDAAVVDYTTLTTRESCCGLPLYLMGSEEFANHTKRLIAQMKATGAHELVTPCAGCYKTFRTLYPKMIGDLGMKVYHTVQYLDKLARDGSLTLKATRERKFTYHDPCDLGRTFGIFEEPRDLLKKIVGIELVEMKHNRNEARCCGGGGNLQGHNAELAHEMGARRVRDALDVGAEVIVSGCPACKDNLRKGARLIPKGERGKIKVADIVEVVSASVSIPATMTK